MASILTAVTIATPRRHLFRIAGKHPWVAHRGIAALALVITLLSAAAPAADPMPTPAPPIEATDQSANNARQMVVSESAAHEVADDGCVFCNGIRRQDEIVVVNTRWLGCNCDPEAIRSGLCFETYASCDDAGFRHWQPSDLQSFLAFDPSVTTVFFVHGNRISPGDAKREGLCVYRRLVNCNCNAPRIRFVILSWPSSRVSGMLRDIQVKAARTGAVGCQLAWLIDQMPAETPITLVGFSFGPRIITGALHILAGGNLGCLGLAEHVHPDRRPVNVFMMASALHSHWLGDGQYHGLAMTQVDRMFLENNCQDPAMRYYALAFSCGSPQALGLCGPTCISAENAAKIRKRDVSCSVGSEHDLFRYLCAPGIVSQIWDYIDTSAATSTTAAIPDDSYAEPSPMMGN